MGVSLLYFRFICVLSLIEIYNVTAETLSDEYKDKRAIVYQGSTYLVTGGCRPPKCDPELEECQRILNAFENLYSYCMQSAHGNFPACLRNQKDGRLAINVPIYASVCDALCHESDPDKLGSLTVCNSPAVHDEQLSNHFGTDNN